MKKTFLFPMVYVVEKVIACHNYFDDKNLTAFSHMGLTSRWSSNVGRNNNGMKKITIANCF